MSKVDILIKRLTDIYDRTTSSNNYKLLSIDGQQLDDLDQTFLDIRDSHYVELAVGVSLDEIGDILGLSRRTGETDTQYRARILAAVPGFTGGGTIPSIIKSVSEFLGVDESAITILDGYLVTGTYGHFRVAIDMGTVWSTGQDFDKLVILINDVKAAAVVLDSVGPFASESVSMTDAFYQTAGVLAFVEPISMSDNEGIIDHITDITFVNSLNEVI